MSAATFLQPSLVVDNLSVENSLSVTENVSVGYSVTVANLVSAGSVASASTISAVGNIVSAGTVGALGYTGGTIDISGNAEFGSNGADTFKVHGTGGSGVQSAFVADPASPGAVYSEPEADAVRDAVVSVLTCLKNHGFMAPA